MYVAQDRKPEDGCEIQNAADGVSGIIMQLKLVKGGRDHESNIDHDDVLNHGTNVLLELVRPFQDRTRAVVIAYSYFTSKQTERKLKFMNLDHVGVIKTSEPEKHVELRRGESHAACSKDEDGNIDTLAFVWCDRERRYFIATTGDIKNGTPSRWRQTTEKTVDQNAPPEFVTFLINQPLSCEISYSENANIDQHNRCRQDGLKLETKWETKRWDMRVNMSILGMIIVESDAYQTYKKAWLETPFCRGAERDETQHEFHSWLAEELIDTTFDTRGRRHNEAVSTPKRKGVDGAGKFESSHLNPTKRKKV